jgi:hypothetical protein
MADDRAGIAMSSERWDSIREGEITGARIAPPHVGTLREKPLHADLKRWYSQPGDRVEEPVGGFVIDLVRGDLLIEIQTGSFSAMRRKLKSLLEHHAVHVVHPIAATTSIVKVDEDGEVLSRRRSPKRGAAIDLFEELVSFPELIAHPRLSLEVLLVHSEEVRRFDGRRGRRRKGWVIEERRLLEVVDGLRIDNPDDLARWLPHEIPQQFTTAELARALRRHRRLAQQMAYCLRRAGVIEVVGKQGNALVYERTA